MKSATLPSLTRVRCYRSAVFALLFVLASYGASAGITTDARPDGVTVSVKGLARDARLTPHAQGTRLYLREGLDARRKLPRAPLAAQGLEYSVRVPSDGAVTATMQVTSWKPLAAANIPDTTVLDATAQIVQRGRASGVGLATMQITPWRVRHGAVEIADTFTVTVSFDRPLQRVQPIAHDRTLAPLLNAAYADRSPVKRAARTQELDVDPSEWYTPGRPYVVLSTSRDGVARVPGRDIIALDGRFQDAPLSDLRLTLHGREVPLQIDGDTDGKLTGNDDVYFLGRRPHGDTTYWDRYDTVSTFMLTLQPGERLRYEPWNDVDRTTPLDRVVVHDHVEYDTGYYHLGSHPNPIFAEYLTEWSPLEGYYWAFMNFRTYDRLVYQLRAEPFESATRARLSLWFAGVTSNPDFAPEHKLSFKVNGGSLATTSSRGYLPDSVVHESVPLVSGANSFKVYAEGREEFRDSARYVSQVVVDRLTASYEAKPWLRDGRLIFQRPFTFNRRLVLSGARSQRVFAIDTQANVFAVRTAGESHTIVRVASSQIDANWTTLEPAPDRRRLQVSGPSDTLDQEVTDTLVAVFVNGDNSVFFGTDDQQLMAQRIAAATPGTTMGFVTFDIPLTEELRAALRASGAPEITTDNAVASWQVGTSGSGIVDQSEDARPVSVAAVPADPLGPFRRCTLDIVPASTSSASIFIADTEAVETPLLRLPDLRDLSAVSGQTDVIYITTPKYRAQVDRLAEHRQTHDSLSTMIFEMQSIFDEYAHGQHTPYALKAFLTDLYARLEAPKPRYLLLVGNASFDPRIAIPRGNLNSSRPDEVPTFGRPSSDYWFGLLDGDDVAFPELIVGRLPVVTEEQCSIVVSKVIQHDLNVQAPWHRRFLFVGGGEPEEGFCTLYEDLLSDPFGTGYTVTGPPLCLDTVTICKADAPQLAGFRIKQALNDGAAWMNYLGHGATEQYDITGWDPNELDNGDRQGFMATYACQTGAYSTPSTLCKNATYLIEPDAGMIGTVGGTGWTFIETVANLFFGFHDALRTHGLRTMGDVVYFTKTRLAAGGDQDGINTAMQQSIVGDPLSHVRIDLQQDLYTRTQDVTVQTAEGSDVITEADGSMHVQTTIQNAGIGSDAPVEVLYRKVFAEDTITVRDTVMTGVCVRDVSTVILPIKTGQVGRHVITITIDPDAVLVDEIRTNNELTMTVDVLGQSLLPIEPQASWTMPTTGGVYRALIPGGVALQGTPEFVIATAPDTTRIVVRSAPEEITSDSIVVEWRPTAATPSDVNLWFGARVVNTQTTIATAWSWVPYWPDPQWEASESVTAYLTGLNATIDDPSSVHVDTANGAVKPLREEVQVYLRSIGVQPSTGLTYSPVRIEVDSIAYVNEFWKRGVNIVVVDQYSSAPRVIRRYDTYKDPIPVGEGENAGGPEECITFLRDSILPNDRVLLALCDESMSGFIEDTMLTSFIDVLKGLGAQHADSLDLNSSYALIGSRIPDDTHIWDAWKGWPDTTVSTQSTVTRIGSPTMVRTDWVGPARRFTGVSILASPLSPPTVIGRDRTGMERTLDVDQPIPSDIEYLRANVEVGTAANDVPAEFQAFQATFLPASEWLIPHERIRLTPDSVLRGDTSLLTVPIRNPYSRFTNAATTVMVSLLDENNVVTDSFEEPLDELEEDDQIDMIIPVRSLNAVQAATVRVDVNSSDSVELYRFNDRATTSWKIGSDTVPPTIEVWVDSVVATSGMWVLREPFMEVIIHDNAKIPVNDSTKLLVYVNGDRIRPAVASEYAYYPTAEAIARYSDPTVRSAMTFRYPLELGQNNVSVRALDATGNSATLDLAVYTTDRTEIRDVAVSPNPFSDATNFLFELASDKATMPGRVLIYDLQGRTVRTITTELTFGRGSVLWDGRSTDGLSMPTGVYVWRFIADDPEGPSSTVGTCQLLR